MLCRTFRLTRAHVHLRIAGLGVEEEAPVRKHAGNRYQVSRATHQRPLSALITRFSANELADEDIPAGRAPGCTPQTMHSALCVHLYCILARSRTRNLCMRGGVRLRVHIF